MKLINTSSVNSMEGPMEGAEDEHYIWTDELLIRMDAMLDRKRSSVQGREEDLRFYVHILRYHYAHNIVAPKTPDLVAALLKSVKFANTPTEPVMALKALAVTILTDPSEQVYDACAGPLKSIITNAEALPVKAEAIHTLGTLLFFTASSSPELTEDTLAFLLEIVSSDGAAVSADDDVAVVAAALDVWALLASQLDDLEDASEDAISAFAEQLESSDAGVQVSAGEAIALLYEKSFTALESDEEPDSSSSDKSENGSASDVMRSRYTPYRRKDVLLATLDALANISSKHLSKKDRKALHANFADIAQSVRRPTLGPRYSAAIDDETDRHYGSRMSVKVGREARVRVDRWWKLIVLKGLKRVLQGGFAEHWRTNEAVGESLPA